MIEAVKQYIISLIIMGFISAVVHGFLPDGAGKRIVSAACGLLLVLIVIRPIADIDLENLARSISRAEIRTAESSVGYKIDNEAIISGIIKEKCEAYILDKAESLGFNPNDVTVEVKNDGGYPFPHKVSISGQFGDQVRLQLSAWIEQKLAIGRESQEWIWS